MKFGAAATRSRMKFRGILTNLPSIEEATSNLLWKTHQQRTVLQNIVIAGHNKNQESTYLGAETSSTERCSGRLFGWYKPEGQKAILAGQIAGIEDRLNGMSLRMRLCTEDAQAVVVSGWGRCIEMTMWQRIIKAWKHDSSVEVLLSAPRNQHEVEQITKIVLDAAIWWTVGMKHIEDV